MTLRELITIMRDTLDDKGGRKVDWTDTTKQSLLRWTNEELTRYINAAERETAVRTHSLIESELSSVCKINVVAGTSTYKLHPKILMIENVQLDLGRYPLTEISWRDAQGMKPDWQTYEATPSDYMRDWQKGKIRIYPTPLVDDTLRLMTYRLPMSDMTMDNWESDDPEIDEQWQDKMLSWAMHMAYQKDEPNTLDPDKVMFYLQKYESEIGPQVNLYAIERRKQKNRQTGYGGIRQTTGGSHNRLR